MAATGLLLWPTPESIERDMRAEIKGVVKYGGSYIADPIHERTVRHIATRTEGLMRWEIVRRQIYNRDQKLRPILTYDKVILKIKHR